MGALLTRRREYAKSRPYDAEVEYITFSGTQYITIPICPNDGTDAIEFEFRRTTSTNQVRLCRTESDNRFNLYINGSGGAAYNYIKTNGTDNGWQALNNTYNKPGVVKHIWKVDYKNNRTWLDFDQYTITNSRSKAASTGRLQICQLYSSYTRFVGQIYHVRYWRDDVLIYDLVPVRHGGVGYLYDKLSGEMYGNDGTGNIGIGMDKYTDLSEFTELEYIENTTQVATSPYIDTGISSGAGTIDMSMTVKWGTIDSARRQLMGCNNGVFWGCDEGTYRTNAVDSEVVPSTTDFETVNMDTYTGTPSRKGPLALFRIFESASKANTTTTYICNCKLAMYKIWVNNALVRHFVPVQHPGGTKGMFDKVENKFYFSANSGSFTGA